ncbi:HCP-like protein [Rhizopus microsporus var. microsporus]|uniref:HCP-like protein n=2 Tax=Rhizopus microsporus TaxID=58291 RepID=A0A2G4T7P3_RHIZD|nr:HCP-like protein [Rhizopus microsporus ATCC 52813]ORE08593.1 HCP-like protein [Rhizopus microsporus var. microsporus]PHZ17045.1 HCP-like protein [Rhizopus microsporus ATCC 52813]
MPPTPPTHLVSTSDIFLNHTHLKPGNNAELLDYEKTINMYRENAKHINDPNIQWDLATYLYESSKATGNKVYMQEAIKILKSLSLKGHGEAQYYLANIYASGNLSKSHKPDFNHAFPLFVQAAKHQHPDAAYRTAKCYEDGLGCLKNKSKAYQYYRLAATLNHPGAMYRLGLAELNGDLGLKRNVRDGNKWLKRSADAATPEYPHALHELGLLHEKGLDDIIFKDPKYSVQLYARAAELGYAPSAYRLGQCFEYGYLGCPKDSVTSVYYYTIAAKRGHPDAAFALSAWYLVGDGDRLQVSEEKALEWARLSAEKGLPKAEFALGYFAEMGIGRPKDINEAMVWYKKAADHGNEKATRRLKEKTPLNINKNLPAVATEAN